MLDSENTKIIAIDLQDRLVNMLDDKSIIKNCANLLKTAHILGIDTIITEQYPKGLGSTIDEIKSIADFKTIEKTTFSAYRTDKFKKEFNKNKKKNVVIFGIEAHICVYQTALDLSDKGYKVYFAKDCSASRKSEDLTCATDLMRQVGIRITTSEILLFEFLKSSKHKDFKQIQALIK